MLIRPDLARRLAPWRPALVAVAAMLLGGWVFSRGGWVFWPLGTLVFAGAGGWLAVELAHLRLRGRADGPGMVEVEEGMVRYFAARVLGGEVSLRDLAEVRVLRLNGRAHWRLRTRGGEALLIPADAAGAEVLADAFAGLPGADLTRIAAALARAEAEGGPAVLVAWTAPRSNIPPPDRAPGQPPFPPQAGPTSHLPPG
ncbi:hypothetical protein DRW48_02910 [Paracoccus suum]|uniref:Uncharacterized protein n=1 Tax=Paracoccus suum TaxID=2259340 RepID=A0A344PHC5_9RHOB|nr:hypothetical protein [Paracoccus suum]AXC48780.1 hypothetical protein DRW48_02910 [Paracoccus suum]